LVAAACSYGGGTPAPGSPGGSHSPGSSSIPGPRFSLSQINNSFSAMSALKPLASEGKGTIAVILPRTPDAKHFRLFDRRYLKEAFHKAGLTASQYKVQLAVGNHQYSVARTAIGTGASVLILDARYSGVGASIESYAKKKGVQVIDYDWLTLGGSRN